MNMISRKPQHPVAPVEGKDVLAALERRLVELQARDADLLAQIIDTEKTSHDASKNLLIFRRVLPGSRHPEWTYQLRLCENV